MQRPPQHSLSIANMPTDNMELDSNADFVPFQAPSISSRADDRDSSYATREKEASKCEDEFADIEYWFGSIYFQCVLAQDVFDRVTSGCSFLTVDVRKRLSRSAT